MRTLLVFNMYLCPFRIFLLEEKKNQVSQTRNKMTKATPKHVLKSLSAKR